MTKSIHKQEKTLCSIYDFPIVQRVQGKENRQTRESSNMELKKKKNIISVKILKGHIQALYLQI
jgi:hypothetical protein